MKIDIVNKNGKYEKGRGLYNEIMGIARRQRECCELDVQLSIHEFDNLMYYLYKEDVEITASYENLSKIATRFKLHSFKGGDGNLTDVFIRIIDN